MNVSNNVIKEIVRYGTLATSADNCQPWLFNWDGEKLDLMVDKERSGFFYDINHESTYMTLGAATENIRITASHFGLKISILFNPTSEKDRNSVAQITFSETTDTEDPLFAHLIHRGINRYPFKKVPITTITLNKLEKEISSNYQTDIHWVTDENKKTVLRDIIFNADKILFEDKRLHSGLFKWIWTDKKNASRLDGMSLDIIGLSSSQRPFFKLLANWGVLSKLNKLGISAIPAINSVNLLKSSPVYCLLTVKSRGAETYFKAGRAFERLWIKANSLGLAVQPMAGFVFLMNHYFTNDAINFAARHRSLIGKDAQKLEQMFKNVQHKAYPAMFLRFGYPKKLNIKSKRRPIEEVLTMKS